MDGSILAKRPYLNSYPQSTSNHDTTHHSSFIKASLIKILRKIKINRFSRSTLVTWKHALIWPLLALTYPPLNHARRKKMKTEEKPFIKESSHWKTADDRLQERLLWQDLCNKAIKRQLLARGATLPGIFRNQKNQ